MNWDVVDVRFGVVWFGVEGLGWLLFVGVGLVVVDYYFFVLDRINTNCFQSRGANWGQWCDDGA